MKMELLQPFINSADAVLAQTLRCATTVGDVTMEEEGYRRQGLAAIVLIRGEIEGRIILDVEPRTAVEGRELSVRRAAVGESAELVRETVCELANMLIGNAVTSLNDQGFHFKVAPPELHTAEEGFEATTATRTPGHVVRDAVRRRLPESRHPQELAPPQREPRRRPPLPNGAGVAFSVVGAEPASRPAGRLVSARLFRWVPRPSIPPLDRTPCLQ